MRHMYKINVMLHLLEFSSIINQDITRQTHPREEKTSSGLEMM